MQVNLTNLTIVLNGVTLVIPEVSATADAVDLLVTNTTARFGNLTLDTPRTTHVSVTADSVLVEDMTPGNEEKGVLFTPLGTASEDDEPGLWGTIYGGRVREADAGTFTSGELWFGHADRKVGVVYDPNGITVEESGY